MQAEGKRVAVIGFGPAGMVATKSLLQAGLSPVAFEAAAEGGGLWNANAHRLWKSVCTNLSKFACSFSDFRWREGSPLFPGAKELGDYLQGYADRFIPASCVRYQCKVTHVAFLKEKGVYQVSWKDFKTMEECTELFVNVVVASGFFSCRKVNSSLLSTLSDSFSGQILHSAEYSEPAPFAGKAVAVVGGSFSGCEIAAELAYVAEQVVHITPESFAILPRLSPENAFSPRTAFLPVDLVLYKLSAEKCAALQSCVQNQQPCEQPLKSDEERLQTLRYFHRLAGHPEDTFSVCGVPPQARVSICNGYQSLVSSGLLQVHTGYYLTSIQDGRLCLSPSRTNNNREEVELATPVDAIIFCTGYQPDFSFLEEDLLRAVDFQAQHADYLPCDLTWNVCNVNAPGLYFVGIYRGPYFAGTQMQAELVAKLITGQVDLPSAETALRQRERVQLLRSLPRELKPQFPHVDHLGHVLDLFVLQHKALPALLTAAEDQTASYPEAFIPAILNEDSVVIEEMKRCLHQLRVGHRIASSIFQALAYSHVLSFHREILDHNSHALSTVTGQVTFKPLLQNPRHLLYHEEGKLHLNGQQFEVSQNYIYCDNEEQDCLDIFFCKVSDKEAIDRPFLSLRFQESPEDASAAANPITCGVDASAPCNAELLAERRAALASIPLPDQPPGWTSVADHLCGQDMYRASCSFGFHGLAVQHWSLVFDVLGPNKNYRSRTTFSPLSPSSSSHECLKS